MTRVLGAAVALACVALLSSCALLPPGPTGIIFDDSKQQSDFQMRHIADAVKNHDAAALKKLFSPRAREKAADLDSGLAYFLSVFPSGRMTWESDGTATAGDSEYGKQTEELFAHYTVSAGGKKYDLYFVDFTVNKVDDPHNVGLYALGVAPYTADRFTASGAPKPFYEWSGSFDSATAPSDPGTPGVYVPQK